MKCVCVCVCEREREKIVEILMGLDGVNGPNLTIERDGHKSPTVTHKVIS
jgi:hypothetical protein